MSFRELLNEKNISGKNLEKRFNNIISALRKCKEDTKIYINNQEVWNDNYSKGRNFDDIIEGIEDLIEIMHDSKKDAESY